MWKDLLNLKSNMTDGQWIMGGEFNAIYDLSKRKGISPYDRKSEQREFNTFSNELDLVNLSSTGN